VKKSLYIGYNGKKEYNANYMYMNYNKMIHMHNGMLNLFSFTSSKCPEANKKQQFF
jgi:hypothetical protein